MRSQPSAWFPILKGTGRILGSVGDISRYNYGNPHKSGYNPNLTMLTYHCISSSNWFHSKQILCPTMKSLFLADLIPQSPISWWDFPNELTNGSSSASFCRTVRCRARCSRIVDGDGVGSCYPSRSGDLSKNRGFYCMKSRHIISKIGSGLENISLCWLRMELIVQGNCCVL